jgi:hypothetical protein
LCNSLSSCRKQVQHHREWHGAQHKQRDSKTHTKLQDKPT